MDDLLLRLLGEIEKIPLIDTHEHLFSERARCRQKIDLFSWFADYSSTDLISAGMSPTHLDKIQDTEIPLDERWNHIRPFWKHAKSTGYGRVLLRAARDLYEVSDINENNWRELSEKISASNQEGWYKYVLKEKGNIEVCILDEDVKELAPSPMEDIPRRFESDLFVPVARFDDFILISSKRPSGLPSHPPAQGLIDISTRTNVNIHGLDDFTSALDVAFEQAVEEGIVGVKCAVAYDRIIHFKYATREDAGKVLNAILSNFEGYDCRPPNPALSWSDLKPLQDYMMHQVIRRAIKYDLPLQFHTGLHDGNANFLYNSNPIHLTNLFMEYPEAKFNIFHAGYPFTSEVAVLGKTFPNVYIDLCWVWAIGSGVAQRILDEWIELVPSNKILGFGGDYVFVEGAYASSRLAREGIAHVLASKIRQGYISENEAVFLAQRFLRDNAREIFKL